MRLFWGTPILEPEAIAKLVLGRSLQAALYIPTWFRLFAAQKSQAFQTSVFLTKSLCNNCSFLGPKQFH